MTAWVGSEAARLALASDLMLAVGAATVLVAHGVGRMVHRRALTPTLTWSESFVAISHGMVRCLSTRRGRPAGSRGSSSDEATIDRSLRASAAAGGAVMGLAGVVLVLASGHGPSRTYVLAGALVSILMVAAHSLARSRDAATRQVLSRRGMHLIASSMVREVASVAGMVVPVLVVAHTGGVAEVSLLEVVAVALIARLVIAAMPFAGGLIAADATMVAGLAWMGIPASVGLAAVLVWRLGTGAATVIALVVARRTQPVTVTREQPTRDGAGRLLHRVAFTLIGLLPTALRVRARSQVFDTMFALSPDPWGYSGMPYEQRKRRLLVQAVDPRSRVVLEVGCADGHNLLALAEALPKAVIVGTDVSNRAVRIAADRTRHMPGVRVVDASDGYALEGVVQSRIDCVLLAEILYYLGGRRAMTEALAPLRRLLSADARVVMLHGSSDAEELHARAASALGLIVTDRSLVADPERPFVIAVASRRE